MIIDKVITLFLLYAAVKLHTLFRRKAAPDITESDSKEEHHKMTEMLR